MRRAEGVAFEDRFRKFCNLQDQNLQTYACPMCFYLFTLDMNEALLILISSQGLGWGGETSLMNFHGVMPGHSFKSPSCI